MTIVSTDELVAYMSNITLSDSQLEIAELVLEGLQQSLEDYLGRAVEVKTVVTTGFPNESGFLRLDTPVVSVASVEQNEITLAPEYYELVPGGIFIAGLSAYESVVTYSAGIAGTPAMKLAILRAGAREMTYKHDDTLSIKGLTSRNVAEGEPKGGSGKVAWGLQPEELAQFDRYRRRVVDASGTSTYPRLLMP